MLTSADFRDLVSGRRKGPLAAAARAALRLAEVPYRWEVRRRNVRYDQGRATVQRVSVPVISVGNLTLGGTGKTPMVKWLAGWLAAAGRQPGIVSRGYGSAGGSGNDEARELRRALPNVPHVQDADRLAAAREAVEYHHCDVILLDDGFQHRRLDRDVDIVLLDALEPFGFEHVFPRGTLREPLDGLRRTHVVGLSRADAVAPHERRRIQERVLALAPGVLWCEAAHAPSRLINSAHAAQSLASLRGARLAAFCGIGNPAGFRHTLAESGGTVAAWLEFPDHHAYSGRDLAKLAEWAKRSSADIVLCTHKDLVKIRATTLGEKPLWAVEIDIAFLAGESELQALLQARLAIQPLRQCNDDVVH
jgi:tetraacyldisaccharide 4'-kinase